MSRVLVSAPYILPVLDRFEPVFRASGIDLVVAKVREKLTEEELMPYAGAVDGAICGDDAYSARVLRAAAPKLRVISKWGTGTDSIDRDEASRLGIQVFNTPGAFTDAVADHVMGIILAFARRIPWTDRILKAGQWRKPACVSLAECALGVVGVGRIGKAVLLRGSVFGMELRGNDIVTVDEGFCREAGVRMVGLEELLERSDFVSLNCDLNPTSLGLIDGRALARMKPSAILVNTARGSVIDEQALIASLREGKIGGAGLDVFQEEPLPPTSPLYSMDTVLLSAHNANSSPRAWEQVHRSTIDNLFRGLNLAVPKWPEGTSRTSTDVS